MTLSKLKKIRSLVEDVAQACIDWTTDTGGCHLCGLNLDSRLQSRDRHDDDCPVGRLLRHLKDAQ